MASNVSKTAKPSSVASFKKGTVSGAPIELPSGNIARVRRVSLQVYLKTGRIPNVLMAPVQKALQSKGGDAALDEAAMAKMMEDPNMLKDLFSMVDMLTVDAFIEPKVSPEPAQGADRDDELLYVDEIDLDDKMFIFQWMVGGTSDLEEFRNEQRQQLGTIPASTDVAVPTK